GSLAVWPVIAVNKSPLGHPQICARKAASACHTLRRSGGAEQAGLDGTYLMKCRGPPGRLKSLATVNARGPKSQWPEFAPRLGRPPARRDSESASGWIITLGGYGDLEPKFEGARHHAFWFHPIIDYRAVGSREWLSLPSDGFDCPFRGPKPSPSGEGQGR